MFNDFAELRCEAAPARDLSQDKETRTSLPDITVNYDCIHVIGRRISVFFVSSRAGVRERNAACVSRGLIKYSPRKHNRRENTKKRDGGALHYRYLCRREFS